MYHNIFPQRDCSQKQSPDDQHNDGPPWDDLQTQQQPSACNNTVQKLIAFFLDARAPDELASMRTKFPQVPCQPALHDYVTSGQHGVPPVLLLLLAKCCE
jgi:hypothetical protein